MDAVTQARKYLAKCEPSISGQGGHNQCFSIACILVHGFALGGEEARSLLAEWNQTCQPPFSAKELEHKLRDAERSNPPPEGRGHMLSKRKIKHTFGGHAAPVSPESPKPVTHAPKAQGTKYEITDLELPEPIPDGMRALLTTAFLPGEGVRIGSEETDDDGKFLTIRAVALPREQWLEKLDSRKGDADKIWSGGAGVYIGINPMSVGGSKDSHVSAYRHALIEWDGISEQGQWSIIKQSNVPATAVIRSGGKSVHAWVKVDAKDEQEYRERVRILHEHFEFSGCKIDPNNKNPSRLSRLAGVKRKDRRQELLALNIGAESFTHWLKERQGDDLGPCLRFTDLMNLNTKRDPNCVIGFKGEETLRYLCKGKAMWIIGPSGIGKSTLISEFTISWALGKPAFGIAPARALRSLIIQAENDDYDLAEMAQGIIKNHELNTDFDPDGELARINENVIFKTESCIGLKFLDRLHRLIEREKPDIVCIDPLLSFAGIDVSKQDQVSQFLREGIDPILAATGCVMIGLHHTGKWKASQKDMATWTDQDYAYAGLGSSELVNWARAIMTVVPLEEPQRAFRLALAKRGPRAGATNTDGSAAKHAIFLQHSDKGLRWIQIEPPMPTVKGEKPDNVTQIATQNIHDVLSKIPASGEDAKKLGKRFENFARSKGLTISAAAARSKLLDKCVEIGKLQFNQETGLYLKGANA